MQSAPGGAARKGLMPVQSRLVPERKKLHRNSKSAEKVKGPLILIFVCS